MLRTPRRLATPVAWFWALSLSIGPLAAFAQTGAEPTRDGAVEPAALVLRGKPVGPRSDRGLSPDGKPTTAGWWLGPVGIAAALAVVGGVSLASKRFGLNLGIARDGGPIAVVGQTRLSPKHSVYLVRVGGRVLILGAGQGGSTTPLGEITDPTELARFLPRSPVQAGGATPPVRVAGMSRTTAGFDQRIGDDE